MQKRRSTRTRCPIRRGAGGNEVVLECERLWQVARLGRAEVRVVPWVLGHPCSFSAAGAVPWCPRRGRGWGGALRGSGRRAGKGTLWALILLHAFYTYKPILHPVRWLGRGLWKHTDESWSPVTCQSPDFITLLT